MNHPLSNFRENFVPLKQVVTKRVEARFHLLIFFVISFSLPSLDLGWEEEKIVLKVLVVNYFYERQVSSVGSLEKILCIFFETFQFGRMTIHISKTTGGFLIAPK